MSKMSACRRERVGGSWGWGGCAGDLSLEAHELLLALAPQQQGPCHHDAALWHLRLRRSCWYSRVSSLMPRAAPCCICTNEAKQQGRSIMQRVGQQQALLLSLPISASCCMGPPLGSLHGARHEMFQCSLGAPYCDLQMGAQLISNPGSTLNQLRHAAITQTTADRAKVASCNCEMAATSNMRHHIKHCRQCCCQDQSCICFPTNTNM